MLEEVSSFWMAPLGRRKLVAVSKAQQKAVAKYEAKVYDKTLIRLPKGRLDDIKTHAVAQGESVNGFINRAIDHEMERDGQKRPPEPGDGADSIPTP